MILIGSRALALRAGHCLARKPLDFDWVCTCEEYNRWMTEQSHRVSPTKVYALPEFDKQIVESNTTPCEFEIITEDHSSQLLDELVRADKDAIDTPFGLVPSLDLLYTIKMSHRFKKFNQSAVGFWKTAIDIHSMRRAGAVVRDEYKEFLKLREQESYAAQKHPKLNVSKDAFFKDDGIQYVHDHDDIHESVKLLDRPAYTYYLKDGEQVLCDKAKFFNCSEEIRLAGVIEEGLTLSIERSLVPFGTWSPRDAFLFALAKTASSITSGWFRAYCHDHLFEAIKGYPELYWAKFQDDVKAGKVRPFNPSKGAQ